MANKSEPREESKSEPREESKSEPREESSAETELIEPIDAPDFNRLLVDWAVTQINPATGLCRVECCGGEVPASETAIFREETMLSVTVADDGTLLVGALHRYRVGCKRCQQESMRDTEAIREDVRAVIAAGEKCPPGGQIHPEAGAGSPPGLD